MNLKWPKCWHCHFAPFSPLSVLYQTNLLANGRLLRSPPPGKGAKYCDQSVCISVCLLTYLKNRMSKFYEIFYTCCLWLLLGPPLTTVQYVVYFRFCGWCHIFVKFGSQRVDLLPQMYLMPMCFVSDWAAGSAGVCITHYVASSPSVRLSVCYTRVLYCMEIAEPKRSILNCSSSPWVFSHGTQNRYLQAISVWEGGTTQKLAILHTQKLLLYRMNHTR